MDRASEVLPRTVHAFIENGCQYRLQVAARLASAGGPGKRGNFGALSFARSVLTAAVVSGVVAGASVGAAQPATPTAPARPPVRPRLPLVLQVTTPEGCAAERFERALEARVRRPFEVRRDAASVLRVAIAPAGAAQLEGTASFTGASGSATRSVRGSCDEVTSALALVATTWLEAEPEVAPSPPPPDAPAAAPASETRETRDARDAREAPPSNEPLRQHRFAIGAHGVVTAGLVGGASAGAGAALAYRESRLELRGGLRVAFGAETVDAGHASYLWVTAPIDGCVHLVSGGTLTLAGCGRIEPGYFHATFVDAGRALPWLSLATGLRAGWLLGPVRLEVEGFATFPVTGYRIGTTDATIVPFRTVAPLVAAGLMVPFS
jgi:hypothetical protein